MSSAGNELESFRQFLDFQLSSGRAEMTPEESVSLWRESQEYGESVDAIKKAIQDLEAGDRGKPLQQFIDEFRAQHNIPTDL